MARSRLFAAASILSIQLFVGCATVDQKFGDQDWYQKGKQTSAKVVDATSTTATKTVAVTETTASKAYSRMQKYLAEKNVLKTFQDAGEHSETAVLGVLHKSGIARNPGPSAPPGTGAAKGVGPKPGAAPPAAQQATPRPLTGVPEHYPGSLRWPLDAYIVSSEFGERWGKMHKGMDMAADVGEPVYAIAAGEVIYAGDGLRGYGNVIILRHDRKTSSLYAHNSELKVKQGDQVAQGTLIALLGSTGHSTGPHVHFEIRDGDTAVNPRTVLPKPKVAEVPTDIPPQDAPARRLASNPERRPSPEP